MRDQYIGIDLHKAFFQACAVTRDGRAAVGRALPAHRRGHGGAHGSMYAGAARWPSKRVRRRGTSRTAIVRGSGRPADRRPAEDEAEGRLCGEDGPTRCPAAGGRLPPRQRGRDRLPAARRFGSCGSCVANGSRLCRCRTARDQSPAGGAAASGAGRRAAPGEDCRRRWLETLALPPRAAASVDGLRRVLAIVRTRERSRRRGGRARARRDPIALALQQLRGIGPVLALTIRAEIGDIGRFSTPGAAGQRCRTRARAWTQCRAASAWPHDAARFAVAPVGADGSGDARDAKRTRSGRAVGTEIGDAERSAESARGTGARLAEEIHRLWIGIV